MSTGAEISDTRDTRASRPADFLAPRPKPLLSMAGEMTGGAAVFAGVDYLIDERWGDEGGAGLLAAVTLDGVPGA